jgi:hypothetical protein
MDHILKDLQDRIAESHFEKKRIIEVLESVFVKGS